MAIYIKKTNNYRSKALFNTVSVRFVHWLQNLCPRCAKLLFVVWVRMNSLLLLVDQLKHKISFVDLPWTQEEGKRWWYETLHDHSLIILMGFLHPSLLIKKMLTWEILEIRSMTPYAKKHLIAADWYLSLSN